MRLTQFRIQNYRGIRLAEMTGIDKQPVVLLTGRNGTGKSLVLEALIAAWSGHINLPDLVGPYGTALSIELGIKLEANEIAAVNTWREHRGIEAVEESSEYKLIAASLDSESSGRYLERDDIFETLQNPQFFKQHPFASMDLLSARRQIMLDTSSTVDLSMLDRTQIAEQRRARYEDEIRWRTGMHMPDIGSYLTSLDYRTYVATRDGTQVDDDYAKVQEAFEAATGKKILRPGYNPETTSSSIDVELPSGQRHTLQDLSNGEREMLGLLYYTSQLSAVGGVLMLDEPEKHLHPSLQLTMLEAMLGLARNAQIIMVTHSPTLIQSTTLDAITVLEPAWQNSENQIRIASELEDFSDELASIGIMSRDLLQNNFLIIVEGEHDKKRLSLLMPDLLGDAEFFVAGDRHSALSAAKMLSKMETSISWLCIIDRDFDQDEDVEKTENDNVFVWKPRMIENVFINGDLLAQALRSQGLGRDELDRSIRTAIDESQDEAIEQFVEKRVGSFQNTQSVVDPQASTDRVLRNLHQQVSDWNARISKYEDIREQTRKEITDAWKDEWDRYANGKRVLRAIQKCHSVYKNSYILMDNLIIIAREEKVRPLPELARLRTAVESIRSQARSTPGYKGKSFNERESELVAELKTSGRPVLMLNEVFEDHGPQCC